MRDPGRFPSGAALSHGFQVRPRSDRLEALPRAPELCAARPVAIGRQPRKVSTMNGTMPQTADPDDDDRLDEALDQSFPASDPPSMTQPKRKKIQEPPLDEDAPHIDEIKPDPDEDPRSRPMQR
jgi:hypothetical protein